MTSCLASSIADDFVLFLLNHVLKTIQKHPQYHVSVVKAVITLGLAMLRLSFSIHASKLLTDNYYS